MFNILFLFSLVLLSTVSIKLAQRIESNNFRGFYFQTVTLILEPLMKGAYKVTPLVLCTIDQIIIF